MDVAMERLERRIPLRMMMSVEDLFSDKGIECFHPGYRVGLTRDENSLYALLVVPSPDKMSLELWMVNKTEVLLKELEMDALKILENICTCDRMTVGLGTILWREDETSVPVGLSARSYADALLFFARRALADEDLCPRDGRPFPDTFMPLLMKIHKGIFRCYAHAYLQHWQELLNFNVAAIPSLAFKHWLFFARAHGLVEARDLVPLDGLIRSVDRQVAGL